MNVAETTNIEQLTFDNSEIKPRLLSIDQFMLYSGLGRNRAMEYAVKNGWTKRFGKRVFIDKKAFDDFLDTSDNAFI